MFVINFVYYALEIGNKYKKVIIIKINFLMF